MTENKQKYLELASEHTESELAQILNVNTRTIRRYAQEFGIKPKPTHYTNEPISVWKQRFETVYAGQIELTGKIVRDKTGHIKAACKCLRCQTEWQIKLNSKISSKTGCIRCDKGNHGNRYDKATVQNMLNQTYENQWKLVKYGKYSKKDSIIRCTLCNNEQLVNLSDFINTSTMRCTCCQTGSYGEYVISNVLLFNDIPFEREKIIEINNHKYRLDFLIDNRYALEYSGLQHFEKGLYYNEKINEGVNIKKKWCEEHGYEFTEIKASYSMSQIICDISNVIHKTLKTPSSEFFKKNTPDMQTVLNYMKTHSARQTMKDLKIPVTKLKKYVFLTGYQSISAWQADNKVDN